MWNHMFGPQYVRQRISKIDQNRKFPVYYTQFPIALCYDVPGAYTMEENLDLLKSRIYHAAKDGMHIVLYTVLNGLPETTANALINQLIREDDGQNCTPLIIAARCGHEKVVKILLSIFTPELEIEASVKFEGSLIEGASALWCAAAGGHLNIVKSLVKAGADVNHPTKTNSTPLRAACFDGRLDIVKYLTDHYANIHIANKYNNTCLMIASYKGHFEVVCFLLQNNANPNEKAHCGATALHFAAESGYTKIVKELIAYNAKLLVNGVGMTPIMSAADRTKWDVVEFLAAHPDISKAEKIEALELLGASYANDKDNYNLEKACEYLKLTMEMRYSDSDNIIKKPVTSPIPAYDNWIECQTLQELESISISPNSIHMESLAIRERILGVHNPELPHPIVFRGAVFADSARFDRCLELWLHALQLRQLNLIGVMKDLLRFAQVFSQMIYVGVELQYTHVAAVLSASILEMERNNIALAQLGPKDDPDTIMEELDSNVTTTLYIITILTKLLKSCSEEQVFEVNRMIYTLNQMNLKVRDGQTLLHLACNNETPVDDFHTNDVCKFPCVETARLLIKCGADVNLMDDERNTPLHVIVSYHRPISDFVTLHNIVLDLKEAGAHMDCVNARGETPLDRSATGVAEMLIKSLSELSLKCLAAMSINLNKVPYKGQVPLNLEAFIEWHGINP